MAFLGKQAYLGFPDSKVPLGGMERMELMGLLGLLGSEVIRVRREPEVRMDGRECQGGGVMEVTREGREISERKDTREPRG